MGKVAREERQDYGLFLYFSDHLSVTVKYLTASLSFSSQALFNVVYCLISIYTQ